MNTDGLKRRMLLGSLLGLFGFILSPLSWWNDAFINLPLAYTAAWLVSLLHEPAFGGAFVLSYWISNVLGLMLMHKGICQAVQGKCAGRVLSRRRLARDLVIAGLYSLAMLVLVRYEIIQPVGAYFH